MLPCHLLTPGCLISWLSAPHVDGEINAVSGRHGRQQWGSARNLVGLCSTADAQIPGYTKSSLFAPEAKTLLQRYRPEHVIGVQLQHTAPERGL
jgi:hypothetical protein